MKEYKTIEDLNSAPEEIQNEMQDMINSLPPEELEIGLLDTILGGNVFLVETVEDLTQIKTGNWSASDERYLDVTEAVFIPDVIEETPTGKYWLYVVITNNSGGSSYYIPREIFAMCENLMASSEASEGK